MARMCLEMLFCFLKQSSDHLESIGILNIETQKLWRHEIVLVYKSWCETEISEIWPLRNQTNDTSIESHWWELSKNVTFIETEWLG